jgi:uncharacterized protein YbjT (DUF2867 family)
VLAAREAAGPGPRVALVAGASGLTGMALLRLLMHDDTFARVLALSRRPLPLDHPRLANRILRFDDLERSLKGQQCSDAFCALGAPGGPQAAENMLREVDLRLVSTFARTARSLGATRLIVVSAAGARTGATEVFQRVKGEMEAEVRQLGFEAVDLLQPGALLALRAQDGAAHALRKGLLALAAPLLRRSSHATLTALTPADLAAAMLAVARMPRRGVSAYSGAALAGLGGGAARR